MLYKVVKAKEAYQKIVPGLINARNAILHDADDLEYGQLSFETIMFLPESGLDMTINNSETIYYVKEGGITVYTGNDEKKYILKEGDSIRLLPGQGFALKNETIKMVEVLKVFVKNSDK